jgi:hypothetical protein
MDAKADSAARLRQRKYALLRGFEIPPQCFARLARPDAPPLRKTHLLVRRWRRAPAWSLTFMVDGKKRVEHVPEEWVEQIRPPVEQGREFKDAVAEVFAANAQLLALWRRQSTKRKPKKK